MEQRKRLPTGTFERPTTQQLRDRLEATQVGRQRQLTGEHRMTPPPAPGQRPVLDALGNVSAVLGSQVEVQHNVQAALALMGQRFQQAERVTLQAASKHGALARDAIEAVRQSNLLHEQTNKLLALSVDRMNTITLQLDDFQRALQHNSRLRQQAAKSWLLRALTSVYKTPAWGFAAFGLAVAAWSIIDFIARLP